MPLPMIHLAVAVGVHTLAGREPSAAFLLGSIAPDAIHMRDGADRSDKERTHLEGEGDIPGGGWVRPYRRPPGSFPETDDPYGEESVRRFLTGDYPIDPDLAAGYGAHLLTDRYWTHDLAQAYRELQARIHLSPEELRTIYYREMDQIDFELYRTMPWREAVWAQLAAVEPQAVPGLLSADEISRWRDRTLNWFDGLMQEPGITPQYVMMDDIRRFIDQAAGRIAALYERWGVVPYDRPADPSP